MAATIKYQEPVAVDLPIKSVSIPGQYNVLEVSPAYGRLAFTITDNHSTDHKLSTNTVANTREFAQALLEMCDQIEEGS